MYISGNALVDKVTELQTRYDLSRSSTLPMYKLSPEDEYALLQQLNKAKAELLTYKQSNPSQSFWDKLSPQVKTGIYISSAVVFTLAVVLNLMAKRK